MNEQPMIAELRKASKRKIKDPNRQREKKISERKRIQRKKIIKIIASLTSETLRIFLCVCESMKL